jgi:hypothetical protein
MITNNTNDKIKQKNIISKRSFVNKSSAYSPRNIKRSVDIKLKSINPTTTDIKNIPISSSILYDVEYNNTIALYSTYKDNIKRRSYSERNTINRI